MHWSRDWSCTDHVTDHAQITWLIMHWSRVYHTLLTWLIMQWSRSYHVLVTWLHKQKLFDVLDKFWVVSWPKRKNGFLTKKIENHYCVECPLNLEMSMEKEAVWWLDSPVNHGIASVRLKRQWYSAWVMNLLIINSTLAENAESPLWAPLSIQWNEGDSRVLPSVILGVWDSLKDCVMLKQV